MSIVIIDYGSGNLRSVEKAFQKFGFPATVSKGRAAIRAASGLVLPGVGSFDAAIKELKEAGLEVVIEEAIALGKPFLGICLGMQHLFESSEEGKLKGLGLFKGSVKKFKLNKEYSVPHMGWNRLLIKKPAPIFEGIENGNMVYFAHSYFVEPLDEAVIASKTDYGQEFVSAIWKNNVFGIQFHPEKSGETGLKIIKNFGELCLK